jgi:transcriptional regulator with XRE-family HTH domain
MMTGQDARPLLTPALCRAARGLLDWTQLELAEHSEVSRSTIRDYEGCRHDIHRATAAQLLRAFEENGVAIIRGDGHGAGVCWSQDPAAEGTPTT